MTKARVAADTWSSPTETGVNGYLADKAPREWTLAEPVNDGQYVRQMRFRLA